MDSAKRKEEGAVLCQFTNRVIAIHPTHFKCNEECATDNVFQIQSKDSLEKTTIKVC